jgi:hypothetical protein
VDAGVASLSAASSRARCLEAIRSAFCADVVNSPTIRRSASRVWSVWKEKRKRIPGAGLFADGERSMFCALGVHVRGGALSVGIYNFQKRAGRNVKAGRKKRHEGFLASSQCTGKLRRHISPLRTR